LDPSAHQPHGDPRSDSDLVRAINRGDSHAFASLYHRYRDWVLRLAWRFTGDEADALDVLQDTFTYLLEKFPGFRLTAKMTTFLYPVVKHTAIRRRSHRRRTVSADDVLEHMQAPPRPAGREELAAVLANLPLGQREVVLMRFVDEMSLKEIAGALDIPLGTVKSRLHYALKTLREDDRTRAYFLQ
jgi:RNA polymerase sigma-70 factor (ECF subfamily)